MKSLSRLQLPVLNIGMVVLLAAETGEAQLASDWLFGGICFCLAVANSIVAVSGIEEALSEKP